ncbi:MAG: ATP-binding protein [Thermoplasmata archaeon]|nr:ATP-binding protein [Thermoplasmata archaeon]
MPGWLVAVEGPSGAGKTSAVHALARRTGRPMLAEAVDRIRPVPRLTWSSDAELLRLESRLLAEDAARYREGRRLARSGATVLADTGFLGPLTYTAGLIREHLAPPELLGALLRTAAEWAREGRWGLPDAVLYVRTSDATRHRRATADPAGHPPSLQLRHQRVAAVEFELYRTVVRPTLGPRLRFVSGEGTVEEVVPRLDRALSRTRSVAGRRPSSGTLLGALARSEGVS